MNQYVTGAVIKELREKNKITQLQLAEKLGVSDKSVSKWETSRGLPDITLLEPIAEAFSISVTELISGNTILNANVSANMLRSKFYVCPVCGNVIHSMGEAAIHCHGIQLMPLEAEPTDEHHMVFIERVEDEYYVRIDHSMTKNHYISFVAAASSDDMQLVKLYPEGNAEARFKIRGVRRIFFYCNRDGLFSIDPVKGIDDKESGYDDSQERRELEKAADMLFGGRCHHAKDYTTRWSTISPMSESTPSRPLISMNRKDWLNELTENMIRWAKDKLGNSDYAGWCLSFIEDALEKSNGIEIYGGNSAKESALLYAEGMRQGKPERGAFVFYDCICQGPDGPVNWGHCGISLENGRIIHAWDMVRIDDYLAIEKLTALTGDHPKYIGWVALERVLNQKPY